MSEIADKIASGDVRALARAATWIEDRRPEAEALLKELFPRTGHALVLGITGPPGAGKSMLASRLAGILPPLAEDEALEVAAIRSIAKFDNQQDWRQRPYRSPHHTSSAIALVGGGSHPKPGEITLAHKGVLFLDELPEFPRSVLEVMREPLESGSIHISRASAQVTYPAQFQLIAH